MANGGCLVVYLFMFNYLFFQRKVCFLILSWPQGQPFSTGWFWFTVFQNNTLFQNCVLGVDTSDLESDAGDKEEINPEGIVSKGKKRRTRRKKLQRALQNLDSE